MKVFIGKYPKNPNRERKVKVQIDSWDTWNMDSTLALIILPMLKQIKDQKAGAPFVHDEDVPEHLQRKVPETDYFVTDDLWHDRWEYVLDEMIFAFDSFTNDWEDQFWIKEPEIDFTDHPEDEGQSSKPLRWKVKGECDWDARDVYAKRIQKGFELFGKYFQGLWT